MKENNVKVKDGTDVNSIMRDMMSIILESALDQEMDEELVNPLSIGKSIFVCLIKIINYLGYEKNDIHFMHSDRFAFVLLTIRNAR